MLVTLGFGVISLTDIVASLSNRTPSSLPSGNWVALAFDDGSDFDFHDLPHPIWGTQRSMLNIMIDFLGEGSDAVQPAIHATSFVIVSREARRVLDKTCMIGRDWWRDDWWSKAIGTGLLSIGNHSWDHNHPTLERPGKSMHATGTFSSVDNFDAAEHEIAQASASLRAQAPNSGTGLFAYPYGEASDYLVQEYFPIHGKRIGVRAAFTCEPRPITESSSRWALPRYVFGRDWKEPEELAGILRDVQRSVLS